MAPRVKFHAFAILSVGVLVPVAINLALGSMTWGRALAISPILLACLWSSWPSYKSVAMQQAAITLTLMVVANSVLTPITSWLSTDVPTLKRNFHDRFQVTGSRLPGLPQGIQVYSTNDHGHRTNRPVDYLHKPPKALRIGAFGASTTEGVMLDDQKTWPTLVGNLLEAQLHRPVEVINTAVSGTRAIQQLGAFRSSEDYDLDVAIFMMGVNDWNYAIAHAIDKSRPWRDELDRWGFYRSLLWRAAETGEGLSRALLRHLRDPDAVRMDDGGWFAQYMDQSARQRKIHFRMDGVDGDYANAVGAILGECKRRKLLCLFLDQPNAYTHQFEADRLLWLTPPFESFTVRFEDLHAIASVYNKWLATVVRRENQPFCPIAESLPATTDVFFDDVHFNENGARLVAKLVAHCLLGAL
jgi:lysophospholipase L1-like esterase